MPLVSRSVITPGLGGTQLDVGRSTKYSALSSSVSPAPVARTVRARPATCLHCTSTATATAAANGSAVAPVNGVTSMQPTRSTARRVVHGPGSASSMSIAAATAAAMTKVSCQLQPKFSQLPRCRKINGKNASVQRVRPRRRRMKTTNAAAMPASAARLKIIPTRKSGHSWKSATYTSLAIGTRCSLLGIQTQLQKSYWCPVAAAMTCQSSWIGMLRPARSTR